MTIKDPTAQDIAVMHYAIERGLVRLPKKERDEWLWLALLSMHSFTTGNGYRPRDLSPDTDEWTQEEMQRIHDALTETLDTARRMVEEVGPLAAGAGQHGPTWGPSSETAL